jgi:hypothetical protein
VNSYKFWQESIEGLKPKMFVDQPELGFYRKGVYERDAKGNNRRVGWTPVAIFMVGDVMTARIGSEADGRDVTGDPLNELWSYVAANAISEGMYREVARHGKPWPDAHDPSKNRPAEGKTIAQMREESPNFDRDLERTFAMADAAAAREAESPENKLIAEINQAKAGVSQYDKIDSDEMAGRALSLKNEITTLAGKLDKIREAKVRPHVDAQAEINWKYNPIIKDAKAQTVVLRDRCGAWEDWKREQARKAQAEQERKDREHAEAVRRAAAANAPIPEAPAPVAPNAPAPKSQIAAAVGRKASVTVKKFVVSIDIDKTFAFFREKPELQQFLLQMAQRSVDAGIAVPDAIVEERSVVK